MAAVVGLYRTSIGKKVVMAVTGVILFGFMVAHTVGNLKVYQGEEKLDTYAEFLRDVGGPIFAREQMLWILRIVLLLSVVLHIVAAYQLTRQSHASRPVQYVRRRDVQASYASRTMRWGGVIILLFVIYHLLHFTTGTLLPGFVRGSVYRNLVTGFQVWYVSLIYIVAMIAVGMHLYHGVWSMFQTVGLNNPRTNALVRGFAVASALAITLANISIPIAVLAGWLQ